MISIINLCRKFDPFFRIRIPQLPEGQDETNLPQMLQTATLLIGPVSRRAYTSNHVLSNVHLRVVASRLLLELLSGENSTAGPMRLSGLIMTQYFLKSREKSWCGNCGCGPCCSFDATKKKGQPIRSTYQRRSASFLSVYTVEFRGRQIHREHDYMAYA